MQQGVAAGARVVAGVLGVLALVLVRRAARRARHAPGGGFLVPVAVRPCTEQPSKGQGVFVLQACASGTRLWEPSLVTRRPAVEAAAFLASLPRDEASTLLRQSFVTAEDVHSLCSNPDDLGRFMNHSARPNCAAGLSGGVALRDISSGEELTCDYAGLASPDWYEQLCAQYDCLPTRAVVELAAAAALAGDPEGGGRDGADGGSRNVAVTWHLRAPPHKQGKQL
jgi:hypothetical protein